MPQKLALWNLLRLQLHVRLAKRDSCGLLFEVAVALQGRVVTVIGSS